MVRASQICRYCFTCCRVLLVLLVCATQGREAWAHSIGNSQSEKQWYASTRDGLFLNTGWNTVYFQGVKAQQLLANIGVVGGLQFLSYLTPAFYSSIPAGRALAPWLPIWAGRLSRVAAGVAAGWYGSQLIDDIHNAPGGLWLGSRLEGLGIRHERQVIVDTGGLELGQSLILILVTDAAGQTNLQILNNPLAAISGSAHVEADVSNSFLALSQAMSRQKIERLDIKPLHGVGDESAVRLSWRVISSGDWHHLEIKFTDQFAEWLEASTGGIAVKHYLSLFQPQLIGHIADILRLGTAAGAVPLQHIPTAGVDCSEVGQLTGRCTVGLSEQNQDRLDLVVDGKGRIETAKLSLGEATVAGQQGRSTIVVVPAFWTAMGQAGLNILALTGHWWLGRDAETSPARKRKSKELVSRKQLILAGKAGVGAGLTAGTVSGEKVRLKAKLAPDEKTRRRLRHGSRAQLPESQLEDVISRAGKKKLPPALQYELTGRRGNKAWVGVREFTAPEGEIYLSKHSMKQLGIKPGQMITMQNTHLEHAKHMHLQLIKGDLNKIKDISSELVSTMKKHPTVRRGEKIRINLGGDNLVVKVNDIQPNDVVGTYEGNVVYEFIDTQNLMAPEAGAAELDRLNEQNKWLKGNIKMPAFKPFEGVGQKLGHQ